MARGQIARGLLGRGEIAVLVVALHDRDPQAGGDGRLGSCHGRDHDDRSDHGHADERPGRVRRAAAFGPEIGEERVQRDGQERHERHAADARDGAGGSDVVERVADLAPREPAEREARNARVRADPDRGGEKRI